MFNQKEEKIEMLSKTAGTRSNHETLRLLSNLSQFFLMGKTNILYRNEFEKNKTARTSGQILERFDYTCLKSSAFSWRKFW